MKVNIFDVAKKSGLSAVTVSRVINNSPSVRDYNRKKVLQVMEELGYQPNAAARSLAKGKTGVIGLLLTTLNDYFFNEVVFATNKYLQSAGYLLAVSIMSYDDKGAEKGSDFLFQEHRVDGMILLSPLNEKRHISVLRNKKIPFVLVDNQMVHSSASSILVDNYKGGYDVAKHFIGLGHKKIGYIGSSNIFMSSREREKGFLDALSDYGLTPYAIDKDYFNYTTGYNIFNKWVSQSTIPTAIFAADDIIALGAINAARDIGLRIPEDISIAGYDNSEFSYSHKPSLTTVKQPSEILSKNAVEILINIIEGKIKKHITVRLEPELIIRESTATAPF